MSTTKNVEKKNEKRMTQATVQNSCTLPAQLKAMWHDHEKELSTIDKDGNVKNYHTSKMAHVENMGMKPHYVYGKDGQVKACKGYTPAEFNAGVADELLEKNADGKVLATYVYRDRVVNTEIFEEGEEGSKVYSLFTEDEAKKKAKGESGAKSIKVYRKCLIDKFGWSPKLIMDVLTQSRNITAETKRAEKSREEWEAIEKVYIVKNIDGTNHVIEVEKPILDF